ncbi:MAG: prolyl-tRNA synthetase associated domain-containing protein [Clostridia bacterium]|nr:prolyl-tRNA synthetase associated domain-containing protein [Clostridia bacterium]
MILQKGRPLDQSGRLEKEIMVYDLLDKLNIEYERIDHKEANTMALCLEIDKALGTQICKNLFLCNRQKTEFYLLMMPGDKPFKTKDLSAQINSSRLSFAGAEDMEEYLGLTPGSVSVTGLMNDTQNKVKLLVDKDLMDSEYIGCHPNINTSSLKIKTKDIFEVFLPAVNHEFKIVELIRYE